MRIDATLPISTIAAETPRAREVFETFGIDYACEGERSLADVARGEGLDPELLVARLRRVAQEDKTQSWNELPLADLVRHLTNQHHRFVREELALISFQLFELCAAPARPAADLQSLRSAVIRMSDILLPHLREEEDNVFRVIEALEASWHTGEAPIDGELRARIGHMVTEHGTISAQLRTIRELRTRLEAGNETPQAPRVFLQSVAKLEAHLHEYMFLENCILFPRAVALQDQTRPVSGSTVAG